MCDPSLRMRITLSIATTQEVSSTIPINRSLNEIYRVAGFCIEDKDYERAFIYYMRFVSLAVEELPKHKQYKGFSSAEKTKAEAVLQDAFMKAESLKEGLKKKYEEEAVLTKQNAKKTTADDTLLVPKKDLSLADTAVLGTNNSMRLGSAVAICEAICDSRNLACKKVVVAGDLIESFVRLAQVNTSRNVETCGVLCGSLISGGVCHITHAVIPKQTGAADSCDTYNEEEVFAYQDVNNLITLGWIHTHPTQTAFLSSVDLHTHYSYQLMLSEAVAIVVASKFNEVGIFRLSERGMEEIARCRETGFHLHEDPAALFFYCHDVRFEDSLATVVVDLR
uniref:MPN domain-containing protein n=1 Tax=Setaria digitata TaxID=48799 RepID=A0A915PBP6_9BILA